MHFPQALLSGLPACDVGSMANITCLRSKALMREMLSFGTWLPGSISGFQLKYDKSIYFNYIFSYTQCIRDALPHRLS